MYRCVVCVMKECHECGNEYKYIGSHWQGDCSHKQLTQQQYEVTVGLLMGDGSLDRSSKNPYLRVGMISPNYLEYLDGAFGILGNGVSLMMTAEENAEAKRESGFRPNADAENYSDMYQWRSISHPELHEFADWYSSGTKVWPGDIDLTPTVLKHWYCGDGGWNNSGGNNHIQISMSNEVDNTDKVDRYFERAGLPSPSNYNIQERSDGSVGCEAQFTVEQSRELLEYMGEPLPDFEYKWPDEYC